MLSKGFVFSPPREEYGVLTRDPYGELALSLNCRSGSSGGADRGGGSGTGYFLVEYADLLGAGGSSPPGVPGMKPFLLGGSLEL